MFKDAEYKKNDIIFKENDMDTDDIIKKLTDDYSELINNGEKFKAMKRAFSIYKIQKDHPNMKRLTSLFNSNLGKIYEINYNLKTILLLKTMYDDPLTMKRVDINLKFLKIDPNDDLNKIIKENDKVLNNITVD